MRKTIAVPIFIFCYIVFLFFSGCYSVKINVIEEPISKPTIETVDLPIKHNYYLETLMQDSKIIFLIKCENIREKEKITKCRVRKKVQKQWGPMEDWADTRGIGWIIGGPFWIASLPIWLPIDIIRHWGKNIEVAEYVKEERDTEVIETKSNQELSSGQIIFKNDNGEKIRTIHIKNRKGILKIDSTIPELKQCDISYYENNVKTGLPELKKLSNIDLEALPDKVQVKEYNKREYEKVKEIFNSFIDTNRILDSFPPYRHSIGPISPTLVHDSELKIYKIPSPNEYEVELWYKLKSNWKNIISITYSIPKSRLYWPYGEDAYKYCTFIINTKKQSIRNKEGDYRAAGWVQLSIEEDKWR